ARFVCRACVSCTSAPSLVVLSYHLFSVLMIRRPPSSTLFPTRRSSDLGAAPDPAAALGSDPVPDPLVSRTAEHARDRSGMGGTRSEEHTSELQSRENLVCRLLLEKKKRKIEHPCIT